MTVGILKLVLFIPESNSLKEKRMVLHSLKARLRNSFNVSIAQLADDDKWQRTTLAIVGVDKDRRRMDSYLQQVLNFINEFKAVELIEQEMELV